MPIPGAENRYDAPGGRAEARAGATMVEHGQEASFASVPLLEHLAPEQVRSLARLGVVRRFERGDTVFAEGEPGDALFIIVEGLVRVVVSLPSGDEATLAILSPGESVGELALFDGGPRSATAIASEPTQAIALRREDFLAWLDDNPQANAAFLRTLSQRVRDTNRAFAELAFIALSPRLAGRLLTLCAQQRVEQLRITQQELASLLGVTREAVNKSLKQFEASGWIAIGRGSVTVLEPAALGELT